MDRRDPPRFTLLLALYLALGAWITLTTSWAIVPAAAWLKYDPSIKTLLFAAFVPFVFRSRVQIEAYVMVILFSAVAHILPWGLKTMVSGGGYNQSLGQLGSNTSFLAESSVISAVCLAFIPLMLSLSRHNTILPPSKLNRVGFYGLIATFAVGSIGTFARTALVGLAVLYAGMWWRAKRKTVFTIVAALGLAGLMAFTSTKWTERISTVSDFKTENSSATRLAVWAWTWNFAQQNPFGGGFNAYVTNRIETPSNDPAGQPDVQFGRAYHNIYFAALGEHGYPGLFLYLSILAGTFLTLQRTRTLLRGVAEHAWCFEMAGALQIGLATFLACAAFVDVSFNPILWDQLALALCLREYARRVAKPAPATLKDRLDAGRRPAPVLVGAE